VHFTEDEKFNAIADGLFEISAKLGSHQGQILVLREVVVTLLKEQGLAKHKQRLLLEAFDNEAAAFEAVRKRLEKIEYNLRSK
jgi:hypothetical protein